LSRILYKISIATACFTNRQTIILGVQYCNAVGSLLLGFRMGIQTINKQAHCCGSPLRMLLGCLSETSGEYEK